MLRNRLLLGLIFIPFYVTVVMAGGVVYFAATAVFITLGTWEVHHMMKAAGYIPSLTGSLLIMGTFLIATSWPGVLGPGLTLGILLAMVSCVWRVEVDPNSPITSFSMTLAAGLYTGWLGAHFLLLRNLPQGEWWSLLLLSVTFSADMGAYGFGGRFGKHKLMPAVSPNKTWEGYLGGIAAAGAVGLVLGVLGNLATPMITPVNGLAAGVLVALVAPLGDLTISAFKRQSGVKDASHLLPGHGGVMDRLDTLLVGMTLGYYCVVLFTGAF